jgi:hypothetical protein
MTQHAAREYTGQAFGRPSPLIFTKSWRIKHDVLPRALAVFRKPASAVPVPVVLFGQDAVTPDNLMLGFQVYAGYAGGAYANLTAVKAHVGTNPVIVSVTPSLTPGPRCLDVEPGNATPGQAPDFVEYPSHGGPEWGQKDAGKPVIYCSAGDAGAVISAMSKYHIARDEYLLWLAHWIGYHICGPDTCGYPQADATQYMSTPETDSDAWYSYCFPVTPAPLPPTKPVRLGTFDRVRSLTLLGAGPDSVKVSFDSPAGPPGAPAVAFYEIAVGKGIVIGDETPKYPRYTPKGTSPEVWQGGSLDPGTKYILGVRACAADQETFGASSWAVFEFTTAPAAPKPVSSAVDIELPALAGEAESKTPLPPVQDLRVTSTASDSATVAWTNPAGVSPLTQYHFQASACEGAVLGPVVPGYPKDVSGGYTVTGVQWQFTGLKPATAYTAVIRAVAAGGGRASEWRYARFTTAAG